MSNKTKEDLMAKGNNARKKEKKKPKKEALANTATAAPSVSSVLEGAKSRSKSHKIEIACQPD